MIVSVLLRLIVFALVWAAVTEAAPSAWGYGLVAVPLVTAVSYVLTGLPRRGPGAVRLRGIPLAVGSALATAGWMLWRSVVGGLDVSRRALTLPRPDVAPEWQTYRTTLRTDAGRLALALVISLSPGTLSARFRGDAMDVHVIHPDIDVTESLSALERRIARIEAHLGR